MLSVTIIAAASAQSAPADAHGILTSLYSDITRGDSSALRPLLSADLRWTVGSGGATVDCAQLLAAASHPTPVRYAIDSVETHEYARTLIVDYVRRDRWPLGDSAFTTSWRAIAVFTRIGSNWTLVRHALTWLALPVREFAVDSSALASFVGRYQIAPGYVDDVHWESGHLVATASGQPRGARLVPVSSTAFSPDGVGAVLAFERDRLGRVVDYVQAYPDGRVVRATRLR